MRKKETATFIINVHGIKSNGNREEKVDMNEKVRDYVNWFMENEDGQEWDISDIEYEMKRCRKDGEWFLEAMDEEAFTEFVHDVIELYVNR